MANYNQLVMTYLAAWNERNDDKRRALIEQTWTDGGSYVDSHRNAAGHEAIDVMIATAQKAFPGYVLKLCSGIDAFQAYMRFTWQGGGTPETPLFLKGTDMVTIAGDGRLATVVGFTDAAPAPA